MNSWLIFGPYLVQMKVEEDLIMHGSCRGRLVSETARSAHVWDKGWETVLAVPQEGSEEIPKTELYQVRRTEPSGAGPSRNSALGQGGA